MKAQVKTIISFKVKERDMGLYPTYEIKKGIVLKEKINRVDCNLKSHEHSLYNSDLFHLLLNKVYQKAIKNNRSYYIDSLPNHITLERGFLTTVNIEVEL